jgi:chloramphenicol 3-O phosphotransferase
VVINNPSTTGKIIIINGPSSSGKTTLAFALQKQFELPFLRFSFDLFLDNKALPTDQLRSGVFSWETMKPSVIRGIQQCASALAMAGNNVIFDHIIETKSLLHHLIQSVSALDVFFVGLHCSLSELERREIQRGNRPAGDARADLETVHNITSYDLELNSENPVEQNAKILIGAWKKRKRPGALDKMIQDMNSEI